MDGYPGRDAALLPAGYVVGPAGRLVPAVNKQPPVAIDTTGVRDSMPPSRPLTAAMPRKGLSPRAAAAAAAAAERATAAFYYRRGGGYAAAGGRGARLLGATRPPTAMAIPPELVAALGGGPGGASGNLAAAWMGVGPLGGTSTAMAAAALQQMVATPGLSERAASGLAASHPDSAGSRQASGERGSRLGSAQGARPVPMQSPLAARHGLFASPALLAPSGHSQNGQSAHAHAHLPPSRTDVLEVARILDVTLRQLQAAHAGTLRTPADSGGPRPGYGSPRQRARTQEQYLTILI
ncbi:hypothetical protein T492DRAFT_836173 [Pavlovales sp. CCMP2436]|nr:hypothetical protein T492DRAFT_836173 [Pavlovales sp. CCMP2436]